MTTLKQSLLPLVSVVTLLLLLTVAPSSAQQSTQQSVQPQASPHQRSPQSTPYWQNHWQWYNRQYRPYYQNYGKFAYGQPPLQNTPQPIQKPFSDRKYQAPGLPSNAPSWQYYQPRPYAYPYGGYPEYYRYLSPEARALIDLEVWY
jgi:hypothetical protein